MSRQAQIEQLREIVETPDLDGWEEWWATLTEEDKVVIDGTSALFGTNVFVFQQPRMIGLEVTYDFAAQ